MFGNMVYVITYNWSEMLIFYMNTVGEILDDYPEQAASVDEMETENNLANFILDHLTNPHSVNSLRPSDAYMRQ